MFLTLVPRPRSPWGRGVSGPGLTLALKAEKNRPPGLGDTKNWLKITYSQGKITLSTLEVTLDPPQGRPRAPGTVPGRP